MHTMTQTKQNVIIGLLCLIALVALSCAISCGTAAFDAEAHASLCKVLA